MQNRSDSSRQSTWSSLHQPSQSWRAKLTGGLNERYIIPRIVRFFYEKFGSQEGLSFVEIGAGMGDLTKAIIARSHGTIARYVASEQDASCVEWLKSGGIEAIQADGMHLPFDDASFDVSVEFDVLHHVSDPRKMAAEMLRVARGKCLIVESNGLSVFRKLRELTPGHRRAGERSFTPRQWKNFFLGHPGITLSRFEIFPFQFPVPCPNALLSTLVAANHALEKVPFFRWQCSNVAIYLEYRR